MMGMKAPVGPPICTREPPKADDETGHDGRQMPAVGDMPEAIAKAIASGSEDADRQAGGDVTAEAA